jgi:pilus assembly protein CpaE
MSAIPDSARSTIHSVALIVPDTVRRRDLATAFAGPQSTIGRVFDAYPLRDGLLDIVPPLDCDVVVVDLDKDVEQAIRVIESICSRNASMTVMAHSSRNDSTLMRRSMQAGAREFLVEPLLPEAVGEALARASGRRPNQAKAPGKMLVFVPSKGGVGVTSIALNFALALTKESGAKVVLVDLDFQLGEVALGLGMSAPFSVADALLNPARLDKEFLSTLLLRHSSGLAVLASAEEYNFFHSPLEGAGKLFQILREEFAYVVVDAGTCHSHIQETLFKTADTLYLVTEMTVPALRNAHRLLSFLPVRDGSSAVEVILNRFNSRLGDIDENSATKALGRPVNWRVPNSYAAARAAQNSGIPLAMENSPITRVLVQMAKAACGKPLSTEKKVGRGFSFFRSRPLPAPVET